MNRLKNKYGIKFEYYNPYPYEQLKDNNDCYIRAICKSTGLSYSEVYHSLYTLAEPKLLQMNDNAIVTLFLKDHGFKIFFPNDAIVLDFMKCNINGNFLIATKNHIVSYIDGTLYDTMANSNMKTFVKLEDFLDSRIHKYYMLCK